MTPHQLLRRQASHYVFAYALERKRDSEIQVLLDASSTLEGGLPIDARILDAFKDRLFQDFYRGAALAGPMTRDQQFASFVEVLTEVDPKC